MVVYVDGDAFPNVLKIILYKAITKLNLQTIVIANKKIDIGTASNISYEIVDLGADEADNEIVKLVKEGDLVITADIPLADRVISKDAHALDHRGELYTVDNIKHYLAIRNLMQGIRDSGELTKGPKAFNKNDIQNFANSLNKFFQSKK